MQRAHRVTEYSMPKGRRVSGTVGAVVPLLEIPCNLHVYLLVLTVAGPGFPGMMTKAVDLGS